MMTFSRISPSSIVVVALAAAALATGCGADPSSASADASTAGSDLNGTWRTACFPTPVGFATTSLTYTNLALEGTYTEYSDNACTQAIHVSRWTGTTTVPGPVRDGATPIDIAFATFTSTALTDANATQNNMYQYCGFTDWRANVTRNVLGAMCQGFAIPVGARSLDIYRVEGGTLRFGQNALIAVNPAESTRPTMIDAMRVFTRR